YGGCIEDEEEVDGRGVDFRPRTTADAILHRARVEADAVAQKRRLGRTRIQDVEPDQGALGAGTPRSQTTGDQAACLVDGDRADARIRGGEGPDGGGRRVGAQSIPARAAPRRSYPGMV